MSEKIDIVVIGAGASGLAAAVEASRAGASVLVLEKNHVPGRKILSTGAGKCNFSNASVKPGNYHPASPAFLKKTFSALPPAAVPAFFEGLGLLWTEGEDGKLFPRSMKAQDLVNVLLNELASLGAQVRTLTEVLSVSRSGAGFAVEAQKVPPQWDRKTPRGEKVSFSCRKAVLAAGGPCYPQIGGSSAGYDLLRALGHSVSPVFPSLVPLKARETFLKELDGVRLQAVLTLRSGSRQVAQAGGELLFTDYGLSGPAALDVSRAALKALSAGPVLAEADLFPDVKGAALEKLLAERAGRFAARPFLHFAAGLHNDKVMKVCAALAGIPWQGLTGTADTAELRRFASLLKALPLEIYGALGFGDAMVAAGGCPAAEVDPATFASKKAKGLYVTGELLDLDGDSGGYNLHLAWTSGILAGRSAAAK
ncbi:MAG: BaiN/RdsA family NAD(P)/FAD-dependent oxidoreductase [Elusimicrobiales bacterium]